MSPLPISRVQHSTYHQNQPFSSLFGSLIEIKDLEYRTSAEDTLNSTAYINMQSGTVGNTENTVVTGLQPALNKSNMVVSPSVKSFSWFSAPSSTNFDYVPPNFSRSLHLSTPSVRQLEEVGRSPPSTPSPGESPSSSPLSHATFSSIPNVWGNDQRDSDSEYEDSEPEEEDDEEDTHKVFSLRKPIIVTPTRSKTAVEVPVPEPSPAPPVSLAADTSESSISQEFNTLREYFLTEVKPLLCFESARRTENRHKNRYPDILPNEHSRVRLKWRGYEGSDYINANYVVVNGQESTERAEAGESPRYIACQAPIPSTMQDFWRMVVEQNVPLIIMLTNLVEKDKKKADQYWPSAEGETETYGDFRVTLLVEKVLKDVIVRKINVVTHNHLSESSGTINSISHDLFHVHWTGWGDMGIPTNMTGLRTLFRFINLCSPFSYETSDCASNHIPLRTGSHHAVEEIANHYDRSLNNRSTGPMVVHCSAGVGRTGALIAIDVTLRKAISTLKERVKANLLDKNALAHVLNEYRNHASKFSHKHSSTSSPGLIQQTCPSLVGWIDRLLDLNVASTVKSLRWQRMGMIQTQDQYVFIYHATTDILLRENLPILQWALNFNPTSPAVTVSSSPREYHADYSPDMSPFVEKQKEEATSPAHLARRACKRFRMSPPKAVDPLRSTTSERYEEQFWRKGKASTQPPEDIEVDHMETEKLRLSLSSNCIGKEKIVLEEENDARKPDLAKLSYSDAAVHSRSSSRNSSPSHSSTESSASSSQHQSLNSTTYGSDLDCPDILTTQHENS